MAQPQEVTYRGNCVCGRYRYELCLSSVIETASSCTCSVCLKKGYLWLVPPEGSFEVIRDDGCLREHKSKAISHKDAYIGVYPTRDQVQIHGRENGWEYGGLRAELGSLKMGSVTHCKRCGVHVFTNIYGPPISVFDKLPPERKAHALEVYHKNMSLQPLNVRAIEGFQLLSQSITITRSDEGTEGYVELLEPWGSSNQAQKTSGDQISK
ncbi:glutathione-dependent formaldehyde-activating enzyme [Diaporthe helianthi]|uniref:Glutathione-dependent formaldehyde-activating enzyme n=1 Tax=Diaporthe helianthi TaxID=158607 RepID=A0A2P5HKC2_DIAHE|nr:glutathione-dependent formaldehyde-activating enzyme [Diaporthe helianthi]